MNTHAHRAHDRHEPEQGDAVSERQTPENDALLRLVRAAIQAHRDQHMIYGSTSTCGGGPGGQAMTQHCSVTCGYFERHEGENARWEDVERAYFRRQDGDPEWADYIPGGRLSTTPIPPGATARETGGES